ncbi:MAG: hypothetical protein J1E34_07790 [Oscillospiraceae bacterium]|nr:hypothetical protein [Oscillospiraceae bacterium]
MNRNIEAMKKDVKIMTSTFKNAMIFEKYVKIWSDAHQYINQLLKETEAKISEAESGIVDEELNMYLIDDEYAEHVKLQKKDTKKRIIILSVIVSIIIVLMVVDAILAMKNNYIVLFILVDSFWAYAVFYIFW